MTKDAGIRKKAVFVTLLLAALCGLCALVCLLFRGGGAGLLPQADGNVGQSGSDGGLEQAGPDEGLSVVTSFYPVYIAALNITDGVEGVRLENLSEPQTGCLHDYQLSADDVRLLSDADLFLINGGGMEGFLKTEDFSERFPGLSVVPVNENLSKEKLLPDNAHYWMDIDLYEIYVQKIAIALSDADITHAPEYMDNYAAYIKKLEELLEEAGEIRSRSLDCGGVILNEALIYFVNELGIRPEIVLDLDDGAQVSGAELSEVIDSLTSGDADIIISDNVYGADMAKTLADETHSAVFYIDPLTTGEYHKDAYIDGMRKNLAAISEGF